MAVWRIQEELVDDDDYLKEYKGKKRELRDALESCSLLGFFFCESDQLLASMKDEFGKSAS